MATIDEEITEQDRTILVGRFFFPRRVETLDTFIDVLEKENVSAIGAIVYAPTIRKVFGYFDPLVTFDAPFELDARHRWRQLKYRIDYSQSVEITGANFSREEEKMLRKRAASDKIFQIINTGNSDIFTREEEKMTYERYRIIDKIFQTIKEIIPTIRASLRHRNGKVMKQSDYDEIITTSKEYCAKNSISHVSIEK